MSVLKVHELCKSYRRGFIPQVHKVLHGVSFSVEAGSITGFLGANGAGKTTTMKCILGLAFPDSGEVEFFDGQRLSSAVKTRIGFLPEHPYFYDYLTGEEFLRFYGEVSLTIPRPQLKDRVDQLLAKVGLKHAKNRPLRGYSKGMLQKVGIAQALIHEPELVILDEPLSGLDPDGRLAMNEIIRETAKAGTAVFLSSHLLNDAEKHCDRVVILKDGRVRFEGPTSRLLDSVTQSVEVVWLKNGQKMFETVSSTELVQGSVDRLRRDGAQIVEIRPLRMSLEEAFVKIAFQEMAP